MEASSTSVGFVAAHDPGPLFAAHRPRAAVGQQVDKHIHGVDPADHVVVYKLHDRALWQLEWDKPIDWGLIHPKR